MLCLASIQVEAMVHCITSAEFKVGLDGKVSKKIKKKIVVWYSAAHD